MKFFAEKKDSKDYVQHRVDEVTKACFDYVVVLNGPDEYQPIDADQEGSDQAERKPPTVSNHRSNVRPLLSQADENQQGQKRPDDAMANDLKGIDRWEQLPI